MKIFLIVGPSGSGKDTLIRYAREYFNDDNPKENLSFVRRYITRPPDHHEDNYYVDPRGFDLLDQQRFFVSTWRAHANRYGIPWSELGRDPSLNPDLPRLCSVSRTAIADFEMVFPDTVTIEITADREVLATRLAARGREQHADIERRLARATMKINARRLISFDNSGSLQDSRDRFIGLLAKLSRQDCFV